MEMSNLDNFEVVPFISEPPKEFEIREVSKDIFRREIAFHEASHFVFCLLIQKLELGFSEVSCLRINDSNGNLSGLCRGCTLESEEDGASYLDEPRRLFPKLLMQVSGYISYLVFIEDNEYFIGYYSKEGIKYFSLDHVSRKYIDDFRRISDRLDLFYILTCFDNELPILKGLKQVVLAIMNEDSINRAINTVATQLITDGIIEGEALKQLKRDIHDILSNFSIEPYANELEQRFPFTK